MLIAKRHMRILMYLPKTKLWRTYMYMFTLLLVYYNRLLFYLPDCTEIFNNGNRQSGIYTIMPAASQVSFQVYCNLTGGGWTYLQYRFDGRLSFDKTMQQYIDGFGDLNAEFWLGLDKMHALTLKPRKVELEVLTERNHWRSVRYTSFSVGGPTNYTLDVTGYEHVGSYGLSNYTLSANNGRPFTRGCAGYNGYDFGWWFDYCSFTFINGIYGLHSSQHGFNTLAGGVHTYLKSSIMKIQ